MTTTAPPLNGQDINLAARATRLLLVSRLDDLDLTFEQWIVINLVGTGQLTEEVAVRARLSEALGLDAPTIDDLLDGLVATRLLERQEGALVLTTDGTTSWAAGQAIVSELTGWLYRDLDPAELATARRVLVEVTERAEARLRG